MRHSLILTLEDEAGRVGLGECSPPGDGSAAVAAVEASWEELAGWAQAVVESGTGDGWEDLATSARAAADGALLDLMAQAEQRSLAEYLGASPARIAAGVEPSVRLVPQQTVVDLLRAIEPHRQEGIRTFVVAVQPGRDVDFVAAVRSHCSECQVAVDAGGRYRPADAAVFRRLDELEPLWIADPWDPSDVEGLARLQSELEAPICLDVTHTEALRRGACRLARVALQEVGGLTAARRLHDQAAELGIGCRVGTGPELGIGLAQAIAFATLPNCKDPTGLAPTARWFVDELVKPPIELDDEGGGRFRVPERAGLGHVLNLPRVHQHQVRAESWGRPS
jgi:O-succinylbenzoate synthase